MAMAPQALAAETLTAPSGFSKKITKEAIGTVLCLSPWNYPLLCAVNTVAAAVLAGDSVVLKHSDRTPLCADHFADSFAAAGAPKGLVASLHADHDLVGRLLSHPRVTYVQFTGSVPGGRAVYSRLAASRFIDVVRKKCCCCCLPNAYQMPPKSWQDGSSRKQPSFNIFTAELSIVSLAPSNPSSLFPAHANSVLSLSKLLSL
jgi:hypothetical protein